MKKLLVALVVFLACTCGSVSASTEEYNKYKGLDLSAYTDEQLGVYENSRVTDIKESGSKITVSGYAFVKNVHCNNPNALWREIIFINAENPSVEYAYRKQVSATNKGQFLTSNKTLNPNGNYNYNFATYSVTVDTNNVQNYKKTTTGAMAEGTYYVYIRVSDGKHGKLFPLKNVTLSDGSSLSLSDNFSKVDSEHTELKYTKKKGSTTASSGNSKPLSEYSLGELLAMGYSDLEALRIMGSVTSESEKDDDVKPSTPSTGGNTQGGSTVVSGGTSGSSSSSKDFVPVSKSGLLKEVVSNGKTEGFLSERYYIGHNGWKYDLSVWTEEEVHHMEHCVMINEVEACNYNAYYDSVEYLNDKVSGKTKTFENIVRHYYTNVAEVTWTDGTKSTVEFEKGGRYEDEFLEFTMTEDKVMSYARQYYNEHRNDYKEMLDILNEIRAENGVAPVELDDELSILATARSVELAFTNYHYKHQRPNGDDFSTMLDDNGYTYKAVAENIASGIYDYEHAMKMWKESSGHFTNMIDADMNTVGFGWVGTGYGYHDYWTTLLVQK